MASSLLLAAAAAADAPLPVMIYGTPQPTSSARDTRLARRHLELRGRQRGSGRQEYHAGLRLQNRRRYRCQRRGTSNARAGRLPWPGVVRADVLDAARLRARRAAVLLRFASVNYSATVFVDGEEVSDHEGGHLPFGWT